MADFLKTVKMTVDFLRTTTKLPPFTILNTLSTVDHFWFLGTTICWGRGHEMILIHRHYKEEGPAKCALPVTTQAVQPATIATGHLLHDYYSVCLVFKFLVCVHKPGQ
ncbi:hypothetical protein GOODEAATRI_005489 [Goodea atripinnis]|uniref:Uncharacterized protein n=1 Tax=Goodea atripinnis TaxID=208336 RepID=A0ABV0N9J7_9TELE